MDERKEMDCLAGRLSIKERLEQEKQRLEGRLVYVNRALGIIETMPAGELLTEALEQLGKI